MIATDNQLWDMVEEVRVAFESFGYTRLRRTHVVLDPKLVKDWEDGKRTVAQTSADGLRMWLSPVMLRFDRSRNLALLSHEFGHAVQGLYGMFDVPAADQEDEDDHDAVERDADQIGEHVMGKPLYYAPVSVSGRLIQTFNQQNGVRPRPDGLF